MRRNYMSKNKLKLTCYDCALYDLKNEHYNSLEEFGVSRCKLIPPTDLPDWVDLDKSRIVTSNTRACCFYKERVARKQKNNLKTKLKL